MFKDYIKIALKNIRKRQTRSWLTVIGIVIGIAAVVALISLGQGLKETVNQQFQRVGADTLIIRAKSGSFGPPGTTSGSTVLTVRD